MAKPKRPSPAAATPPVALLTHTPSPGLYSRLERAIEALPSTVKTEGLRNRLQKHKEGVAGWELDPLMERVSHDEINRTVAGNGRPDITRRELLDMVHETSPVFTHQEIVLSDERPKSNSSGRIGSPAAAGPPLWGNEALRGDGGTNYSEHLLMQPNAFHRVLPANRTTPASSRDYWDGGHWKPYPRTIAHMRAMDVGDAKRLIELQSDVRNQNVKHQSKGGQGDMWPRAEVPLYDAYPEIFLKELLLDAAQNGRRAIEIPALEEIRSYVHMRPEGIRHVYGSVVPNTLVKAARPLGGLVDGVPVAQGGSPDSLLRELDGLNEAISAHRDATGRSYERIMELAGMPYLVDSNLGFDGWQTFRDITGDSTIFASAGKYPEAGPLSPYDVEKLAETVSSDVADGRLLQELNAKYVAAGLRPLSSNELRHFLIYPGEFTNHRSIASTLAIIRRRDELLKAAQKQVRAEMPQVAREVALGREAVGARRALEDQMLTMPTYQQPSPAPSRRLELTDEFRRRAIRNGIPLGILAPMLLDQSQEASAKSGN